MFILPLAIIVYIGQIFIDLLVNMPATRIFAGGDTQSARQIATILYIIIVASVIFMIIGFIIEADEDTSPTSTTTTSTTTTERDEQIDALLHLPDEDFKRKIGEMTENELQRFYNSLKPIQQRRIDKRVEKILEKENKSIYQDDQLDNILKEIDKETEQDWR